MIVLIVNIHVKPERVEEFKAAITENASNSLHEPGVARFDVMQQMDDPAHFTLVEAYRTPEAVAAHKETAHYLKWRDTVTDWMAEPRTSAKFVNVFPGDQGW